MRDFYKDIYTEKEEGSFGTLVHKFLQPNDVKLSEEDRDSCDKEITKTECLKALKAMANSKSPGLDGFGCEFYKFFWVDISDYLMLAYKEAFQEGELSMTQREGLLCCIPKPGKDRKSMENWRPLTLLNTDYKILSATIANRFKDVLPSVISNTQKGFLKGRFIGENTRLLYDIMCEAENRNIPGLLLMVDFRKAYDSLSWRYMHQVLQHYNFGENARKWIRVLYNNISSRVVNNGYISESFSLSRGVRQGDPLSPYLFILAVEPLATAVKRDENIKGITIQDLEALISQYADDTFFTLDGSEESLSATLTMLDDFGKVSGLVINRGKTKAIWFGAKKKCKMKICKEWNLDWETDNFRVLGIIFNVNLDRMPILNFENAISEIQKMLQRWQIRNLTLFGKITVIKTFALSKLNHILSVIPEPSQDFIKGLERILYNFLWNGKPDKIKRSTMILDYKEGGLKMVDISSFYKGLRISWIKRLMGTTGTWQRLASLILGEINFIFELDKTSLGSISRKIKNPFWRQVLLDWGELQDKTNYLVLWRNENIKVGGKSIIYKNFYDNNVIFAHQLLNQENIFMKYEEFIQSYPHIRNVNFLGYYGLLRAIPETWKSGPNAKRNPSTKSNLELLMKSLKPSRFVYQQLINKKGIHPENTKSKWTAELNKEFTWEHIFTSPLETTRDQNLRTLQFKILHRRVATNQYLEKIRIKPSSECSFCKQGVETISHLFYHCQYAKNILDYIVRRVNEKSVFVLNNEEANILLGASVDNLALNYILLCFKYYIYRCKYQEKIPEVRNFQLFIKEKIKTEKLSYELAGNGDKFEKAWEGFDMDIFD